MTRNCTNIVVLGGGYAGIMSALRIAGKTKRLNTTVTLINGLDHFVERPRLHEQATGTQLKGRPIAAMLGGNRIMSQSKLDTISLQDFERFRPLLFSIAYRMLGTVTEAEDILQESYLRSQRGSSEPINNPKYYLTTIVTRLCLNHLSSAKRQREQYLGPWLPEPLLTDDRSRFVDPSETALTNDSISIAFLVLLESLSAAERAVFLLHEVFDYKFREIAQIVGKSEAACRQLFHRAKGHVAANRPRFEVAPEQHDRLLNRLIETVETGEIDSFLEMLASDIVLVPDGGGQRGAAIRMVKGREAVSAFILGTRRLAPDGLQFEVVTLNGQRAILAQTADKQPFFALFMYSTKESIQLMHVIAGNKLRGVALGQGWKS